MAEKPKQKVHSECCGEWDEWEEWGENFGRRMENAFSSPNKIKKRLSIGGLLFGLFLLSWGVIWLGNDLGYWTLPFPFWPVLLILISAGMVISAVRGSFGH